MRPTESASLPLLIRVHSFQMCRLSYTIESHANAEYMSPGGHMTKLPILQCGAFVVSELEPIINLVEKKGHSLTESMDADEKNDLRAYLTLTEKIFTNAEVYSRNRMRAFCDLSLMQMSKCYLTSPHFFETIASCQYVSCTFVGWTSKLWRRWPTNGTVRCIRSPWITYRIGGSANVSSTNWRCSIGRPIRMSKWWRRCASAAYFWKINWGTISISMATGEYGVYDIGEFVRQILLFFYWPNVRHVLRRFFFRIPFFRSPTELDALVFGHIFTILTTPLPNNSLQQLIKDNFSTLVDLCFRIEKEFFGGGNGAKLLPWIAHPIRIR